MDPVVQVDNLDAILKDPLNADFSSFDGTGIEPNVTIKNDGEAAGDPPAASSEQDVKPTGETSAASAESTVQTTDASPKDEDIQPGSVIKTRDGKHEIPYAVLQKERDRAKALERQLAELSAKLANTAQSVQTGQPDLTPAVEEIISADELAQLKEDAPMLAATFEKLINKIGTLEQTAQRVETNEIEAERIRVQDAIDSNPKLAYVQAENPETFQALVQIDDWAKGQPQFANLSLSERFGKVVAMYEAAHGAIQLPASASGSGVATTDVKSKADAAIAAAMANAAPNTLTDIPGGNPPPASELETLTGMSPVALTNHFMQLDQAGMEKFLAKFG